MFPEIVDGPAPPGHVVGLLVGHVANQVGLTCDGHFNDNEQATEVIVCLVSRDSGAGWTIDKLLIIMQGDKAHSLAPFLNWHICKVQSVSAVYAQAHASACPSALCNAAMSVGGSRAETM